MSAEESNTAVDETATTPDETQTQAAVPIKKYPVVAISHILFPEKKVRLAQSKIIEDNLKQRAKVFKKPVLNNIFYDSTTGCVKVECLNERIHKWVCGQVPRLRLSKGAKKVLKVVTDPTAKKPRIKYFHQKHMDVAGARKNPVVAISRAQYPEEYLTLPQCKHIQRTLKQMVENLSQVPDSPKPVLTNIYYNKDTGCAMVECANEETSSWLHTVVESANMKGCFALKVVTEPVSIKGIVPKGCTIAISSVDYPEERLGPTQAKQFEDWFREMAQRDVKQNLRKKPVLRDIFFDSSTGCLMLDCADQHTRQWVHKVTRKEMMPSDILSVKVIQAKAIEGKSSDLNSTDVICVGDSDPKVSDNLCDNVPQEELLSPQTTNRKRNSGDESIRSKSFNNQEVFSGNPNKREHLNRDWKTGHRSTTGDLPGEGNSLATSGNSFIRGTFGDQGADQGNPGNFFGRNETVSDDSKLFSRRNNSSDGGNRSGNLNSCGNFSQSWNRIGNCSVNDGFNQSNRSGNPYSGGNYSAGGGNWNPGGNFNRSWGWSGNIGGDGNSSYGNYIDHRNRRNAGTASNAYSERYSFNQANHSAGNWSSNRYYEASSGDGNYDLFHRRSQDGVSGNRGSDRFYSGEYTGGYSSENRSFDSHRSKRFD